MEEEEHEQEIESLDIMELEKRSMYMIDDYEMRVYPSPLVSHIGVSMNPVAFYDTLRRFHSAMRTRFMIPVIGGKELSLHQLYVQVTQRGGIDKVICEKRWREVIAAFNFPPTTTSASFVLRKYYLSLLFHYEQVYFFRAQGPLIAPSATLQTKTPQNKLHQSVDQSLCDPTMRTKRDKLPRRNKVAPVSVDSFRNFQDYLSDEGTPLEAGSATDIPSSSSSAVEIPALTNRTEPLQPPQIIEAEDAGPVTRAPTAVENTALVLQLDADAKAIADAPTSGESTPTADTSAISNTEGVREATPVIPVQVTPTFGESASADDIREAAPVIPVQGMPAVWESSSCGIPNKTVFGVINGKCASGYLMTVMLDGQRMNGVLFHPHPQALVNPSPQSDNQRPVLLPVSARSQSDAAEQYISQTQSVRKRKKYKNRAADHPKTNRSAYNFFFAEKHAKLKTQFPNKERVYSKLIGESWGKLSAEEKKIYDEYGKRDKERYQQELKAYKERMKAIQLPRGVLRINREAAIGTDVEMVD